MTLNSAMTLSTPLCCCISVFSVFLFDLTVATGTTTRQLSDVVESLLSDASYKSRIRPGADSGTALIVSIDVNINDISSISEVRMEYSLTMFLRQTWRDERLSYSGFNRSMTLNYNQFSRLWSPDLFIRNLKMGQFHDITVPNRLIRLSPDGTVLYSQRLSVTLACDMQLEKYPMDNQTCKIEFGSYGYTTDDIFLVWKELEHPVEVNAEISLPEFVLMKVNPVTCAANYATTGSFPCLRVFLHLKRRLQFYILQIYLPSLLIVLLSWVSFWIDLDAVPARTSLGILTILTITTQSAGINIGLPAVSFTKAIDVWMATCLVFVFVAFIEYSVVNVLSRKHKKAKKEEESMKKMAAQLATGIANIGGKRSKMLRTGPDEGVKEEQIRYRMKNGQTPLDTETRRQQSCEGSIWSRAQHNQALMVDVVSRVMFPILFTIFQVIYWPFYFL